ncbi:MAG: response regulator [Gammaproteobacteria bacterium]|nr:MAG: response regulator [Gammaproteobacteria bacterium]
MTPIPALLVCETQERARQRLTRRFEQAGFHVRSCDSAQHALQVLERQRFDALLCGLVLRDQDAVSFAHDLGLLGLRLPTVITSFQAVPIHVEANADPEPDWVRKAAEQARVIFTLKSACRASRRYRPRILHIEPDPFAASLVRTALARETDLWPGETDAAIETALAQARRPDLVILNPVEETPAGLPERFQRLARLSADIPLLLHARYRLHERGSLLPEACDLGLQGLDLVEVIQTLLLHGREAPRCAQA